MSKFKVTNGLWIFLAVILSMTMCMINRKASSSEYMANPAIIIGPRIVASGSKSIEAQNCVQTERTINKHFLGWPFITAASLDDETCYPFSSVNYETLYPVGSGLNVFIASGSIYAFKKMLRRKYER